MTTAIATVPNVVPLARQQSMLATISEGVLALASANTPEEVLDIERKLEAVEHAMRNTGLFSPEQVREANEAKVRARWKLGKLLAKVERKTGRKKLSRGQTNAQTFRGWLKEIGLDKTRAVEAQRIGAMPEAKLEKALEPYRGTEDFITYRELIIYARPFWNQERRRDNHARILKQAAKAKKPDTLGPFALIYIDPPWQFEVHTKETTHRLPDDHYPTLSDDEIINAKFYGQSVDQLAQDDCAMFMWCTSANMKRAMRVMEGMGFDYKTHAVWDKEMIGTGYIFRNQHEVLMYGSRGDPPLPIELSTSVFRFKRGKHSAKPPQIRQALERMYPTYGADNRVEIFARGDIEGWTVLGNESGLQEVL